MLCLTRKTNQRIWVGDRITITIIRIDDDEVRLGIDAPRSVKVDREEVRAKKEAESSSRRLAAA